MTTFCVLPEKPRVPCGEKTTEITKEYNTKSTEEESKSYNFRKKHK